MFKIIKKKINAILIWTWGVNEEEIKEARKLINKEWDREWHKDICKRIQARTKSDSNE